MNTKRYGTVLVYSISALLLFFGCKGLTGAAIGAGTGAAVTGTPEGAAVGGASGFVVGLWNDITTWVSGIWSGWFGSAPKVPPPSGGNPIVLWIILILVAGLIFKLTWDGEFRAHVFGAFKRLHKLRRKAK